MGRRRDDSIKQALLKIEAMPPRTALYFDDHFLMPSSLRAAMSRGGMMDDDEFKVVQGLGGSIFVLRFT